MRSENIRLNDIESVSRYDLSDRRLDTLLNGHHKFEYLFENNTSLSDPIVIDKSRSPYVIINGRHRIFLARKKGYSSVVCFIQG